MSLPNVNKKKYEKNLTSTKEIGTVVKVSPPIVMVEGLPNACIDEIIYSESGELGFVIALDKDYVEILMISNKSLKVGERVARSNEFLSVPVGKSLLGQTIDPLGNPVYENTIIQNLINPRYIDTQATDISSREKVTEPFETGVSVVDMMLPLGKGQRELVIGDRKTGKTSFLFQTVLSQAKQGTVVIYASIGKEKANIRRTEEFVRESGIEGNTILVVSSASDPLGLIYLTPYTAMTIAEYFRDMGIDTLVILDDLTLHAKYYREMALIARKFPGREAYPGDIFHAHARLLERAGRFKTNKGLTSITCLPVAETIEGDISGYIQTNLMSITDGHILFDVDMFKEGILPAVHPFLSVTRVGRQTQSKLRWGINRELSSFMALYDKMRNVVHFGTELNEGIKATLSMGEKIREFFNQPLKETIPQNVQIIFFCYIWVGSFGDVDISKIRPLLIKTADTYKKDTNFRKKVDTLVNSTDEFNTLLSKVSPQFSKLVNYMEKSNAKK